MNTHSSIELHHGEHYGKLTVLEKVKTDRGNRYRVGCVCGYSGMLLRAAQLTKGSVTACLKCATSAKTTKES